MLYYTVLYYYYTVLYCTILYFTILYYTTLLLPEAANPAQRGGQGKSQEACAQEHVSLMIMIIITTLIATYC